MKDTKNPVQDMPYEKFLRFGPENLTESELLAIILRTGTKDESAVELAEKVLSLAKYPREGLLGLYDLTLDELTQIKGIGLVKAVKLKSLTEFSMRISRMSAKKRLNFRSASSVAEYFMEELRHRTTECVMLACLDGRGGIIAEKKISEGGANASLFLPREIFIEALKNRAVNILLLHNHPSGDPTPSEADWNVTRDIIEIGYKIDIPLLDHIIIGDRKYVSFRELTDGKLFEHI
ncbi:MAG: DNA repair protein RadC [Lachnospiraceae bacterium]|nr:DNA repair protein RadC [Lachnospiraceae bacterium]